VENKMEIQGFNLIEVNPLLDYLNLLLRSKCGNEYGLNFDFLEDEYYLLELHLNRNDHCVSSIKLEFSFQGPGVYMHSYTEPKQQNKKYNSFLRCVVILIVYHLMYTDTTYTGYKRFEFIGSNTANWISDWLLISKFGFWLKDEAYDPETYQDLLKFKKRSKQQYSKLKQQFKTTFAKRPEQAKGLEYVLDLKNLNYDFYLELCQELLNAIKC
jgi:hypothetical protein